MCKGCVYADEYFFLCLQKENIVIANLLRVLFMILELFEK